jgi:hypothetical protein
MKYLKRFKIFESIRVVDPDFLWFNCCGDLGSKSFDEVPFDQELLDVIPIIKNYLPDLSDFNDITITPLRTIPIFQKSTADTLGIKTRKNTSTDVIVIDIEVPHEEIWSGPKTQATKRTYIDAEELKDCAYSLKSQMEYFDMDLAICRSYLPFETCDHFFNKGNSGEHNYLSNCVMIVYKKSYYF